MAYSFDSNNIRRTVDPEFPSDDIFQRNFTKVTVVDEIRPGDVFEMDKLERSKEQFKQEHKGHGDKLRLSMTTGSETRYLVRKNINHPVPERFRSSSWYWICTFLGLSLPYRWYYYCGVGHLKFKVSRKVYSQNGEFIQEAIRDNHTGGETSIAPIEQDPKTSVQTDSSLSDYNDSGSSTRCQLVEPMPYFLPKRLGYGPPNMDQFQSNSSPPPPSYKEACFMDDGSAQDLHTLDCEYIETTV